MKTCIKCNVEKELTEFPKRKDSIDGYRKCCKKCHYENRIEYQKKYRIENYYKIKKTQKQYYNNNKEKLDNYYKEYQLNNKEKINKYQKHRKLTNSLFKLRCNISTLIYNKMKNNGYIKSSKAHQILGCSYEQFKEHLEKQFTKGMTWENQGEWHLDHIYPVSLAKDEEELIRLNHYTNFQPLWAIDNLKKGNKIIDNTQLKLI